jgi:hypothetical protein
MTEILKICSQRKFPDLSQKTIKVSNKNIKEITFAINFHSLKPYFLQFNYDVDHVSKFH